MEDKSCITFGIFGSVENGDLEKGNCPETGRKDELT